MGTFNDLLIEIGINTKPAMKKIRELEKALQEVAAPLANPPKRPKDPFNLDAETKRARLLIKELGKIGAETGAYQKRLKGLKNESQFKEFRKDLGKYKKDYATVEKAIAARKDKELQRDIARGKVTSRLRVEQNSISSARVRQSVGNITSRDPQIDRMRAHYKEQERLSRRTSSTGSGQSQADKNREDSLKYQIELKKKLETLGKTPQYNRLHSISKQNTALERQIRELTKINRLSRQYADNITRSSGYRRMDSRGQAQVQRRVVQAQAEFRLTGNTDVFRTLNRDVTAFRRNLLGLQTVQRGLSNSTRNMAQSYISLFAVIGATNSLKNVGMDFQSMEAAMLASAGDSTKAGKDLQYVSDMADKMGLNLKATTDAYVKLQFATKGKIPDDQLKNLFTGLAEFGTALKVAPESMKLAQRAISQMASKNQIMAI